VGSPGGEAVPPVFGEVAVVAQAAAATAMKGINFNRCIPRPRWCRCGNVCTGPVATSNLVHAMGEGPRLRASGAVAPNAT
jgi:hypothetical protein